MSLKFVLTIRSVGVSFSNRVSQVKVLWFISDKSQNENWHLLNYLLKHLLSKGWTQQKFGWEPVMILTVYR